MTQQIQSKLWWNYREKLTNPVSKWQFKKKILNIGKPTGIKFNKRKFYLKIKLQLIWKLQFKFDLLNSENNSQIIMYLLIV